MLKFFFTSFKSILKEKRRTLNVICNLDFKHSRSKLINCQKQYTNIKNLLPILIAEKTVLDNNKS